MYRTPFPEFLEDLASSRFVLSPVGDEIDCFRTWETLWMGSIPVVMSAGIDELYEDLPVIIVNNISNLTINQLEEKYEELKTREFKLEKLFADYWINKIRSYGKPFRS